MRWHPPVTADRPRSHHHDQFGGPANSYLAGPSPVLHQFQGVRVGSDTPVRRFGRPPGRASDPGIVDASPGVRGRGAHSSVG